MGLFKNDATRIGFIIIAIIFIFGTFCIYDVNRKLSLTSKVIGYFQHTENVSKINDFEYDVTSLLFTNSGANENEYFAEIVTDPVEDFDRTKKYNLEINGNKCGYVASNLEFVNADFINTFYATNNTVLLTDSLNIKVNFYKDGTKIVLITNNGEKAVKLWQSYIQKNGFKIKIVEDKFNSVIEADNIPSYTLLLYFGEELISTIQHNITNPAILPTTYNGFVITSWRDADGNIYSQLTLPNKDLTLYATVSQTKISFEINKTNLVRTFITENSSKRYTCKFVGISYSPEIYDDFYELLYQSPKDKFKVKLNLFDFLGEDLSFNSDYKGSINSVKTQSVSFFSYSVSTNKGAYTTDSNEFYYSFEVGIERREVNSKYSFTPYIDIEVVCATGDWDDKYNFVKEDSSNNTVSFLISCEINRVS